MEHFCYQNWWSNRTESETLKPPGDCSLQFLTIVGNIFFTYLIILILIYRKCCGSGEKGKSRHSGSRASSRQTLQNIYKGKLFRHHIFIWILTIVLFLVIFLDFAEELILFVNVEKAESVDSVVRDESEGSISEYYFKNVIHYLRLWSPLTSIVTLSLISILYHHIESSRESAYLWLNIIYFGLSSIFSIIKLEVHLNLDLSPLHVKVLSDIVTGIGTTTLFILLVHTFFYHVSRVEIQIHTWPIPEYCIPNTYIYIISAVCLSARTFV